MTTVVMTLQRTKPKPQPVSSCDLSTLSRSILNQQKVRHIMKKRVERAASMNCDGILPGAMEVRTPHQLPQNVKNRKMRCLLSSVKGACCTYEWFVVCPQFWLEGVCVERMLRSRSNNGPFSPHLSTRCVRPTAR